MNSAIFGFLTGLLLSAGWTSAAVAADVAAGHAPTRMQLCQREMGEQNGAQRKSALRECLLRRTEGEAGIAASCRRQLHMAGGQPSAAQQRQLRECEARALVVPSQQLPRRPALRPAPASAASTSLPATPVTAPRRPSLPAREGA